MHPRVPSWHTIIRISNYDPFTLGAFLAPLLHPQVQNIVQVYIRKHRRNYSMSAKDSFEFTKVIRYKRGKNKS
jgi:hypothetical protein